MVIRIARIAITAKIAKIEIPNSGNFGISGNHGSAFICGNHGNYGTVKVRWKWQLTCKS
jgi:hypothetical protein